MMGNASGKRLTRLIIQGMDGEKGRRYYFDIPFANGHINITSPKLPHYLLANDSQPEVLWCDPRPELHNMPHRLEHILRQMCRLEVKINKEMQPIVRSIAVRSHHLRVALNRNLEGQLLRQALEVLDQTVIKGLQADLLPDGEDGYGWFNDSGFRVKTERVDDHHMTNVFDPEGDRRFKLPSGVPWVDYYREFGVSHSWESIKLWDALRTPPEQLELMYRLGGISGLCNYTFCTDELVLHKGLAWHWTPILEKLRENGILAGSRVVVTTSLRDASAAGRQRRVRSA